MMELHEKRGNARYVHYPFSDVVPPPRLSKKRAIAKLIGNSLRRVNMWGSSSTRTESEMSTTFHDEVLRSTAR